ncbi:SHOCT domain-containing protein [Olsenella sp. HMSC062G07]|uniref:SHOCT domain-containing protein n=1 Tax=Olsenella sp. HMSC062G07 TaxID=1739330 RepID=UPI00143903E1|nr:SHOCT domain-containing protein [Olsenella sp. HMSC062G07]
MNDERFEAEKAYEASLRVAREMLEAGIITKEDFKEMRKILIEEHTPVCGGIFAI